MYGEGGRERNMGDELRTLLHNVGLVTKGRRLRWIPPESVVCLRAICGRLMVRGTEPPEDVIVARC